MKKQFLFCTLLLAFAVCLGSGCGDPPHAKFKSACFKVIMNIGSYEGDMAADLQKAAEGSESWPAPLKEKAAAVISQAKLFQSLKTKNTGGLTIINAAGEMGKAAGSFIDEAKKHE